MNAKKIATIVVAAVMGLFGVIFGKWYYTTALEPIDPKRGVFGMAGLEIWIDINAHMPAPARIWACDTLLQREAAVLGGTAMTRPYSCAADFEAAQSVTPYEMIIKTNLDQFAAGADAATVTAFQACHAEKMAAAVTPEEIAAVNSSADGDAMTKVVLAANEAARACKADVGL